MADRSQNILFALTITASAQTFTDISATAGLTKPIIYGGVDSKKFIIETNGCGVAFYDYDNDGWMDILTLSGSKLEGAPKEATNRLYKNNRNGTFTDVTVKAGLVRGGWASALTIGDFDNDGLIDIAYVTGNVYPEVERFFKEYPHRSPRKIFRNLGNGKFSDISQSSGAGINDPHSSRGCAFGDFDNDGEVDWLIMNMNEPPTLLRNDDNGKNNWLEVKLIGTKSNRTAIGARVKIEYKSEDNKLRTLTDEVRSSGSYYSHNDLRVHFGIGKAAKINSIEVKWLGSGTDKISNVASNQVIKIKEGNVTTEKK